MPEQARYQHIRLPSDPLAMEIPVTTITSAPEFQPPMSPLRVARSFSNADAKRAIKQLEERIKSRKFSPRLATFVNELKGQYQKCMKAPSIENLRLLRVYEGQYESTYDFCYGRDGAITVITNLAIQLKECQFLLTYGDYFEQGWHDVKSNVQASEIPEFCHKNVVEIRNVINKEKDLLEVWRADGRREAVPDTPALDNLAAAAMVMNLDKEDIWLLIDEYATRNILAHNGFKDLLEKCHWADLAKKLRRDSEDIRKLIPASRGRNELKRIGLLLSRIEKKYFKSICVYDYRLYQLTEYAEKLTARAIQKGQVAAAKAGLLDSSTFEERFGIQYHAMRALLAKFQGDAWEKGEEAQKDRFLIELEEAWNEEDETAYKRVYDKLRKVARTLKKRMLDDFDLVDM
ncbi:MAG: hypothetical protein Q9195_007483 [Heterodermia aff. obscurata]